eukprot:29138-Hanusia_phi.AAC.6
MSLAFKLYKDRSIQGLPYQEISVRIKNSSPCYTQGNARPERLDSTLIEALRIYCSFQTSLLQEHRDSARTATCVSIRRHGFHQRSHR